jgi:hypothetical protein
MILILALVTVTVFLSGCLGSEVAQIDQLTTTINEHLKSGDNFYNQAVNSANKFLYDKALEQSNNASSEFEMAKTSSQEALIYSRNAQDQVYINYLQLTLQEVEAKINATNELKMAIPLFKGNDTKTANTHVDLANQYMQRSLEYQKQKEEIVQQNPNKFK